MNIQEVKEQNLESLYHNFRSERTPTIFVSPAVNVALIMQAIAGSIPFKKGGNTVEVTSISAIVPCDETGTEMDPNIIGSQKGPVLPNGNYSNYLLLATAFIPQEGSSARTEFDITDFVEYAKNNFLQSYPFLVGDDEQNRYGFFWTHSHPEGFGTFPSSIDYETFKKHTITLPSYHMFIIDKRLRTVGFRLSDTTLRSYIKNCAVVNGQNILNPFIESFIFANIRSRQDVNIVGLGLSYLYSTYPQIYMDVLNNTVPDEGYKVWDLYGENEIHVPSPSQIHEVITPTYTTRSTEGYTQKNISKAPVKKEPNKKKSGLFDEIDAFLSRFD